MPDISVNTQLIDRDDIAKFVPIGNYRLVRFFENLQSDVSEVIPDAIRASVEGPVGAVDNHVPVFDGASGGKIRDSGVDIDALAPLDSPAFTGVPTAPTAAPGTNNTQIATTAFVADANAESVKGPSSATDSAIVLFDGTTGRQVKDSAVLLSALAPIASPTFTGNPAAPTPSVGDNDTSLATTAFVQGEFAARSSTASYFSAHNNGTAQAVAHNTPTKLNMGTAAFNTGANFSTANSRWTPPASRPVMLTGTVMIPGVDTSTIYVAIYKNGAEFKRGPHILASVATNVGANVACIDIPNGTDYYELWAFQNTGVSQNTNGGTALTWFQGTTIQA